MSIILDYLDRFWYLYFLMNDQDKLTFSHLYRQTDPDSSYLVMSLQVCHLLQATVSHDAPLTLSTTSLQMNIFSNCLSKPSLFVNTASSPGCLYSAFLLFCFQLFNYTQPPCSLLHVQYVQFAADYIIRQATVEDTRVSLIFPPFSKS